MRVCDRERGGVITGGGFVCRIGDELFLLVQQLALHNILNTNNFLFLSFDYTHVQDILCHPLNPHKQDQITPLWCVCVLQADIIFISLRHNDVCEGNILLSI